MQTAQSFDLDPPPPPFEGAGLVAKSRFLAAINRVSGTGGREHPESGGEARSRSESCRRPYARLRYGPDGASPTLQGRSLGQ
jgi:hypothetical protein